MGTSKVYKYLIPFPCDEFEIELPVGSTALAVGKQDERFMIWVRVPFNSNACASIFDLPKKVRKFRLAGTGHPLDDTVGRYVGIIRDDQFMWHVFEIE